MSTLSLRSINRVYPGGTHAVKDVNLEVADGEFMVLVGPSGCGKSTTLRMVAGLEPIDGGELFIGEREVSRLEPAERDIAMVFQNYALYPHMTAAENMGFGLRVRGTPKAEIKKRVQEAAELLELGDLIDRKPGKMSGGQRQRVAIGRAIVRQPAAFLFDEPLSNLDAKLRAEMRAELSKLHRRLGATMLYVTHDQVEAMTLGDRICLLRGGVVQQVGTPMDLYEHPANAFVARFIGTPPMNVWTGEILEGGRRFRSAGGVEVVLAKAVAPGSVELGIRPEHLLLSTDPALAKLSATVELVERMGATSLLHAHVGGERLLASVPGSVQLAEGEQVGLGYDPANVRLFV